jgi:1-acyl-sn-glycerol-3-phosphate acyltransferase
MILKAKHNSFIYNFFKLYSCWKINRVFSSICIIGEVKNKNLPILLIANHISWWDGFWAMHLNMKLFQRKFFFIMQEERLRKYWYFKYAGGFSVRKKSKTIIETLKYTAELLTDSKNMVLIFPQGRIQSMHNESFTFEKGMERILQYTGNKIQTVFLANFIDYFSDPKPNVYLYIKEYEDDIFNKETLQTEYSGFYNNCKETQKQRTSRI